MSDVQNNATQPKVYHDVMDASDALERWKDAEEPSESEELEATDETPEEETMGMSQIQLKMNKSMKK